MGEIDTKPIEPVQVALSLFGEKGDNRKNRSTSSDPEIDKEELQGLHKELANCKVQLEAKESAYMQALLKLQQYSERVDELSSQLMKSEHERDKYETECIQARTHIDKLECKTKEMADQLSETVKIREQLSHVLNELKSAQVELLGMETELAVEREARMKALMRTEEQEADIQMEKGEVEVLRKHVEELNEALLMSKQAAVEAEKEKRDIMSQKDAEIDLATDAVVEMQEQLNNMNNQLGVIDELENQIDELENQLLAKSAFVESLQYDLREVNELLDSSDKATSDATTDLEKCKADLQVKEREVLDQAAYIEVLQMELNRLKHEMNTANERLGHMSCDLETLTEDLQNAEAELSEMKEKETEVLVELALLKSELHKARSKVAAAEAAEFRADTVKSGLYLAVQQLALEAGEAKKEYQRLKDEADKASEESESCTFATAPVEVTAQDEEVFENASSEVQERLEDRNSTNITISLEEYKSLLALAKNADEMRTPSVEDSNQHVMWGSNQEVENLKRELEAASARIGEFRTRAEQAASRAEAAENAKAALQDQIRRWQEQKQRRKAALAALREESIQREFNPPAFDRTSASHTPLFKILNMKF